MTELLVKAIEAVQVLNPAEQDVIARAILDFAADTGSDLIDPDHLEDVQIGLAEAEKDDFASDEEIAAAFNAFRNEAVHYPACHAGRPYNRRVYPQSQSPSVTPG